MTVILFSLGWSATAATQNLNALRLEIRKTDVKDGNFTFYFTFLNSEQSAIKEVNLETLQLLSAENQKAIPMKSPKLALLSDTNHPVAVMFVVANYRAFNEKNTKSRAAISEFITKKRAQDLAGVVHYGDTYRYTGLTYDGNSAAETVNGIKDSTESIPRIFAALSHAIRKFEQEGNSQTIDMRYLVIVSDGFGLWSGQKDTKVRDRKVEQTAKRLGELKITPIVIGFAPIEGPEAQGVTMLRQLASRAKGTYRGPNDSEEVFSSMEQVYEEIYSSHVLEFRTDALEPNKTHKVRLSAKVKALEAKSPPAEVYVPKPEGIGSVIWYVVGGSICLLLLVVVIVIIIFVVVSRRKKKKEEEEYYEEQMPMGGGMAPVAAPMAMGGGMVAPAMAQQAAQQYDDKPPANYFGKMKAVSGSLHGRTFYITEEQSTIGRIDGNTIVLNDGSVSSKHAGVRVRDGNRYELHDFGSTNGVFINGKRIKKQFLKDGDKIRIGDLEFVFSVE